jgi:hypothetical protein
MTNYITGLQLRWVAKLILHYLDNCHREGSSQLGDEDAEKLRNFAAMLKNAEFYNRSDKKTSLFRFQLLKADGRRRDR